MKAFWRVLCLKRGNGLMAVFGMLFSAGYIEMMAGRCFALGDKVFSVRTRQLGLSVLFIVLFMAVLGYCLWEWMQECRKAFQVLLLCGYTAAELSAFLFRALAFLGLGSWVAGSILFLCVSRYSFGVLTACIFTAFAVGCVFCGVFVVLFLKYYWRE